MAFPLGGGHLLSAQTRAATSIAAEYLAGAEAGPPSSGLFCASSRTPLPLRPAAAADHHGDWTRRRAGKKAPGPEQGSPRRASASRPHTAVTIFPRACPSP
jgi:hypothetical protein